MLSLIDRVKVVPHSAKCFTADFKDAKVFYGFRDILMDQLVDLGLPFKKERRVIRFDPDDLYNISIQLRLKSAYRKAMRSWTQTLNAVEKAKGQAFHVEYRVFGPPSEPKKRHEVVAVVSPHEEKYACIRNGEIAGIVRRPIHLSWPQAPPILESILHSLATQLEFFALPEVLTETTEFGRKTGLADCSVAAQWLMEDCNSHGLLARRVYGLFLSLPLSFPHTWTEVKVKNCWVPFDPLMLKLLQCQANLDKESWPVTRSLGSMLLPLSYRRRNLVTDSQNITRTSYVTKLIRVCA